MNAAPHHRPPVAGFTTWTMTIRGPLLFALALVTGCFEKTDGRWDHDQEACPDCSVEATLAWSSDPNNDYVDTSANLVIGADSTFLHESRDGTSILVHDSRGAFVRTLGRTGDGPGEFRAIASIKGLPSGAITVVDRNRLTIFDRSLAFVRLVTLPMSVEDKAVVVLGDSTLVVGARRRSALGTAFQHAIGTDGSLAKSYDVGYPDRRHTVMGPGQGGTVWSAPTLEVPQYVLEQWDPETGEQIGKISRSPPWFTDWTDPPPARSESRYAATLTPPMIIDIFQSGDGLLWTLTRLTDARMYDGEAGSSYEVRFDSLVEAIDVASGTVVGARLFDEFVSGFTSHGDIYLLTEDWRSRPVLKVLDVSINRPAS
jgi:6-bladed beta-propeller protein